MDGVDGLDEVDETTIPRSRLRAVVEATRAERVVPVVSAPRVVRDAPEPPRTAARRTGASLDVRIVPWAVPPADLPAPAPPSAPAAAPAPPAPAPDRPRGTRPSEVSAAPLSPAARPRPQRHLGYAPSVGAVDLSPERPTPLTDPPRRGVLARLRRRR